MFGLFKFQMAMKSMRIQSLICIVVTCWERADLLALVCDVCEVVTFPLVSWVRCGT